MPTVIYGQAMFTAANRRDQVVRRWERAAASGGFTPSTLVAGFGPGIVSFNYVVPADDEQQTPGATLPAFNMAYQTEDAALAAQAQRAVEDELEAQGWVAGGFGTFNPGTG